jgi:hypothetical protein
LTTRAAIEKAWHETWEDLPQEQIQKWITAIHHHIQGSSAVMAEMSTRSVERASNGAEQGVESGASSLRIDLSRQRLNTKLVTRTIATAKRRETRMGNESQNDPCHIGISVEAR